jgi:hypothetical protein
VRSLFLSESRCISNLMMEEWGVRLASAPLVVKEHSWEPFKNARPPKFNSDFTLDFVDDFTARPGRSGTMNTVLPNTFGAEVYLYVERPTFAPLHFELMSGAAFPIKHYTPHIGRLEKAIRDAVLSGEGLDSVLQGRLLQQIAVTKSAWARILVVGGDVCFLYFPTEALPTIRGTQLGLAEGDDRQIVCHLDGDEIVCFDGWVRTEVATSEHVLVAAPNTSS